MSLLDFITSLFAPDDCLACGREGALLCSACLTRLPPLVGRCLACNKPTTGAGCAACLQHMGLAQLHAVTRYEGVGGALVGQLKFSGNQSAARLIARAMSATQLPPDALITHLPATTAHIRQRGYDQAQLISQQLARQTGLPRAAVLRRTGQQHQLGSTRTERLQQMSRSLSVIGAPRVVGHHIVIIDDVVTTGSSLAVAAGVLRAAGARSVTALVFAQAY